MIRIYEIEDQGWEVYKDHPYEAWQDEFVRYLENQNEFDLYLDLCRQMGVDFILHTLEEYDEYHLSLS